MIKKFNGSSFLMIEVFDGSFLVRAVLIERDCVYSGLFSECFSIYTEESDDLGRHTLRLNVIY